MEKPNILRFASIVMIIESGFDLIYPIIAYSVVTFANGVQFRGSSALAVIMAYAALELLAGILGLRYARKPEKLRVCVGLAIALMGLKGLSAIFTFQRDGLWRMLISLAVGLLLPALYLYGAHESRPRTPRRRRSRKARHEELPENAFGGAGKAVGGG
jgi:hypothetical protein